MIDKKLIIGLVVLLISYIYYLRTYEDSALSGFWKASPDFCDSAELVQFLLYISDSQDTGYILVQNDSGTIINTPVELSISAALCVTPYHAEERVYDINIKWSDNEKYDFFPSTQTMYYYPRHNKLMFTVGDECYAVLYKDSNTSEIITVDNVKKEVQAKRTDQDLAQEIL